MNQKLIELKKMNVMVVLKQIMFVVYGTGQARAAYHSSVLFV